MDDLRPVYDLFCPSPVLLKDLASFELALNIWQREIFKLRENKTLHKWKSISNTRPASRMPNLPPSLAPGIDKYIAGIIHSIDRWFWYHESGWYHGPCSRPTYGYSILNDFVDFVVDWDGSIHYERTAQRMMLCAGINDDLKFKTACMYFLEEDIVKLWPSVSSYMHLDRLTFPAQCELGYWVGRLRNQLYKVALGYEMTSEIAAFLGPTRDDNVWSAMKYFSSSTLPKDMFKSTTFVRYLLPGYVLDEESLASALPHVKGWIDKRQYSNSKQVSAVLACIKDRIKWQDCADIIFEVLRNLVECMDPGLDPLPLVEFWKELSNDSKQFSAERIIQDLYIWIPNDYVSSYEGARELSLLMEILSCTSLTVRNDWWNSHCRKLIVGIKCDELVAMMELCIGDQTEINLFKQNVLAVYENIRLHCLNLLMSARFFELDDFLKLCCSDERSMKDLQKKLLIDSAFQNAILGIRLLNQATLLKQFIYGSYDDRNDADDYINRMLLSNSVINYLKKCITHYGQLHAMMHFIDTFAPSDDFAERLKHQEFVPALLSQFDELGKFCFRNYGEDLEQLIVWCLEDEDEIAWFKDLVDFDILIQRLLQKETLSKRENRTRGKLSSRCVINQMMKWCLGTDQAVAEFKRKYAHDELFAEWFWV